MNFQLPERLSQFTLACSFFLLVQTSGHAASGPSPAASSAFDAYCTQTEIKLTQQHQSAGAFLATAGADPGEFHRRLRQGEQILEKLNPPASANVSGALLHHWRGSAFAPGASAADFEQLMRNFSAYPQHFSPEVVQAQVISEAGRPQQPDHFLASMRIRQRHGITVVMDTRYDIRYGQLDARHGYSISRSTAISEIASPGTTSEHALSASEEHGFLWRLNTYWSYEERDGGLYLQVEAISLTRSIPAGLGWAIGPYIERIPRESLEFTLHSATNALRK